MAQDDRLRALAGIYKQNDGNTFVILINSAELYLKTSEVGEEKLLARGDGLYDVENTQAKIKFNIAKNGLAHSLTFYLKDRQTVASKNIEALSDKSITQHFKEFAIAIAIFALIGIAALFLYPAVKKSCLRGNSYSACSVAEIISNLTMSTKESTQIRTTIAQQRHNETQKNFKSLCNEGDQLACVEVAKSLNRINDIKGADVLLATACYEKQVDEACHYWREAKINQGDISSAGQIMQRSCENNVAISCHELAWSNRKNKKEARAITSFEKACKLGEEKSCHELGLHHLKHQHEESLKFFKKGCDRYYRLSCEYVKKLERYFSEKRMCLNDKKARACFIMASFEEDYGQYNLAIKQYQDACDMGMRLACNRLEREQTRTKNKERIDTI